MTDFHESKFVVMSGLINGSNKHFETPTKFMPGTLKVFWSGQAHDSTDDRFGWVESSPVSVELHRAPKVGDLIQAYYQDKSVTGQLELEDVKGSPFDPNGILP